MDLSNKHPHISYPQRLFIGLLIYSLLMAGAFVAFQYQREKEFKAEEINGQLQLVNTYILTELEEGVQPKDVSLREFAPFKDIRFSVISEDGSVVFDNSLDKLPGASHLDRKEIQEALSKGTGYTVRRHSQSTGDNYFYSARKGDEGYIVRTAVPYSVSFTGLLEADYGFLRVMAMVMLIMCLLGYFITRRVGEHILKLNKFAGDVEKGMTISNTEPFPNDELGQISNKIVRLYARLQQAQADRDKEHRSALREQRDKERIKKQLTNNINHELKTPVAAIRLSVETLLAHPGMTPEKRRQFLERCFSNTDRLQRLLTDVALITRMDDGASTIAKEPVDLAAIIRDSADNHLPSAEAAGISIDTDIREALPMEGNEALLESVFDNLISNAVSYSGGSRIEIRLLQANDRRIVITLSDNGSGVPDEHLPHLFERFYRIDKGRSRANGGTGLGLSIVKNAVAIHGGTISAANLRNGGLLFTIAFTKD